MNSNNVMSLPRDEIEATVGTVHENVQHPHAVAYPKPGQLDLPEGTSITFAIPGDWECDVPPRKGQIVMLRGVMKFTSGWRAFKARPILPTSHKSQDSQAISHKD